MSFGNSPYQPPLYIPPQSLIASRPPAVWYWYVAYCVAMALLYLACTAGSVALFSFADEIFAADPEMSPDEARVMGVILSVVSIPLTLLFGFAPLLPKGKVAWIIGFVNIGIGMTSACCLPACVPLIIFWTKPELKAYLRVP